MHKGKTKYMTNFQNDQEIHIESEKIEEVTIYKYLGHTTYLKDTTKEESPAGFELNGAVLEKIEKFSKTIKCRFP